MSVSNNETELGYNWQDANPSTEIALPFVFNTVFAEGGACHWMSERSYENESNFIALESAYRQNYPNLFEQLSYAAVVRANTPAVFSGVEQTMKAYYRGATIAIASLEASLPQNTLQDMTTQQLDRFEQLDAIDHEHWHRYAELTTAKYIQPVKSFIQHQYDLLNEPEHIGIAMQIGAQFAYTFLSHARACVEREQEIAWMVRDEESLHGWLAYRNGIYK